MHLETAWVAANLATFEQHAVYVRVQMSDKKYGKEEANLQLKPSFPNTCVRLCQILSVL